MPTCRFPLSEALGHRKANPFHRWGGPNPDAVPDDPNLAANRVGNGLLETRAKPPFKLKRGAVFAMGSCFAREIEYSLKAADWQVLSRDPVLDDDVFWADGRPELGFINRYTTPSMALELERSFGVTELGESELLNAHDGGLYFDPHFTTSLPFAPLEVCTRRRALTKQVVRKVREADIFVLTLGLNEVWFDTEAGRYLNVMPRWNRGDILSSRYEIHTLTVSENVEVLERIYRVLRSVTERDVRMIVTVSPVSMQNTFTPSDIVVANTEAKATLRAAAAEFCAGKSDVSYFQSYEMVMLSELDVAFRRDRQHVNRAMVDHIIATFSRDFVEP